MAKRWQVLVALFWCLAFFGGLAWCLWFTVALMWTAVSGG